MESFVTVEPKAGGYALVTICREPVNSMNLELWTELDQTLARLEADAAVRGVIFLSGLKKDVFTAGNDLLELYAPKTTPERYRDFWIKQNTFLAKLYRSPLVTVAAIRGACPAGGCCLALCCDYRVMTDVGAIGLNEVALGIPVPEYWAKLMLRSVGQRRAERLLEFGVMPDAAAAKDLGLVDELVAAAALISSAEATMTQLLTSPDAARQATKGYLRRTFSQEWEEFCKAEVAGGWALLSHPRTVAALGAVLERLSKSKKG